MTAKYYILADGRGEFLRSNSTGNNWFSAEDQASALYVEANDYESAVKAFADLGFEGNGYTVTPEGDAYPLKTHFGFAEYDGKEELYDGNFDATCSGTEAEVVGFLQNLRVKVDTREEGIQWRGRNGTFYSGQVASKAISAEVARIEGRE